MNDRELVRLSKRLSKWLRHDPRGIGLEPDPAGWVPVDVLLRQANAAGTTLTRDALDAVVARNNKQRYEFDETGTSIRARQGHSIPVELGYTATEPPSILFHGTAEHLVEAIMAEGLRPMRRHAVHLSADVDTARAVGARHGRPVIVDVAAERMYRDGHSFYRTGNGVWLVDAVLPVYLAISDSAG
ncbi:RNA 2'-phosphotransferase [Nocardia africana]|uniref:Probable RNA 2'-phosphotransferase n=1 Tax=Nocardia africana TaxID=134964 RepID=A0A378WNT9_9NOCA|nr:RNA 2'-phosphotransferase [Nocardia africana]MCC3314810.1 RNA 2'-phosphotransferase [Nocardia africana]SUA42908.1 RNA 2'-phosphotransferase [Nocardia africana]